MIAKAVLVARFAFASASESKGNEREQEVVGRSQFEDMYLPDAFVDAVIAVSVLGASSALLKLRQYHAKKLCASASQCAKSQWLDSPKKKLLQTNERCRFPHERGDGSFAKTPPNAGHQSALHAAKADAINTVCKFKTRRAAQSPRKVACPYEVSSPSNIKSETYKMVLAVRHGKANELPGIFDSARARLACLSPESEAAATSQLLLSALRACATARCFTEAFALYKHAASFIGQGTAGIWSILLYSAVQIKAYENGWQLFQLLCASGPVSSHDLVNIVRCFAYTGDTMGLKRLLAYLQQTQHRFGPDTWSKALASCAGVHNALEFAEIVAADSMCSEAMDVVGFNTLMTCNARSGCVERCFELRDKMVAKGIQPSEITFGILLDACVKARKLDQARSVFNDLSRSEVQINAVHCTILIKGLINAGQLEESEQVIQAMLLTSNVKPDLIAYSTLVKAHADNGDVNAGFYLIQQMLAYDIIPNINVFNNVLSGCCVGEPRKAAEVILLFEELCHLGLQPTSSTVSILLKSLERTGAWSASLDMLSTVRERYGLKLEMRLFAQLGQACINSGRVDKALQTFELMVSEAQRRGERIHSSLIRRFLRQCLIAADLDTASRIHDVALRFGVHVEAQCARTMDTAVRRG